MPISPSTVSFLFAPVRRNAVAAALTCAFALPGASAQSAPKAAADFPALSLGETGARGQRAIDLLGDRIGEVAAWYRRSPQALRELLLRDPTVRLDAQGRLYVVEEQDIPLAPRTPAQAALDAELPQLAPLSETFTLHSRPGAQRTLYLDFNGAVLTNTAWNAGGGPRTAQAYDIDGNPASFSDAELTRIQGIWQRVAEDYAPFNVDVTTEAPPPGALTRSNNADATYGTTVLITNRSGVYTCECGGVAYVGVYNDVGDFYKPALVFWDALGNGDEKFVAEAASHEAGHNLGLSHDGYSGGAYYDGHGSGPTGWAPIMGVGYYQPLVQWSRGEYATANNREDDFAVIQNYGAPLRPDDHGNTGPSATALTVVLAGNNNTLSGSGVLHTRADFDVFRFQSGVGAASVSVSPDSKAANADLLLEVRNSTGAIVGSANPTDLLNATVNFNVTAPGTYYLRIDGRGKGNPTGTGYTDYGSVGQYTITGSVPAP